MSRVVKPVSVNVAVSVCAEDKGSATGAGLKKRFPEPTTEEDVALIVMLCGLPVALSVTLRVAVALPAAVGE